MQRKLYLANTLDIQHIGTIKVTLFLEQLYKLAIHKKKTLQWSFFSSKPQVRSLFWQVSFWVCRRVIKPKEPQVWFLWRGKSLWTFCFIFDSLIYFLPAQNTCFQYFWQRDKSRCSILSLTFVVLVSHLALVQFQTEGREGTMTKQWICRSNALKSLPVWLGHSIHCTWHYERA